jgi:hypothetical protein
LSERLFGTFKSSIASSRLTVRHQARRWARACAAASWTLMVASRESPAPYCDRKLWSGENLLPLPRS